MNRPLMPKATAVWLIDNTTLNFEQIAKFCDLHLMEVQGIADGDVAIGIQGYNPVDNGQLTSSEIQRCEKDSKAHLKLVSNENFDHKTKISGTKYTPISLRQDKPFAIYWLIKKYDDELTDSQITKLVGSTKLTVNAIRNGRYREPINEGKNPVDIGLCSYEDVQKAIARNKRKKEKLIQSNNN